MLIALQCSFHEKDNICAYLITNKKDLFIIYISSFHVFAFSELLTCFKSSFSYGGIKKFALISYSVSQTAVLVNN